MDFHKIYYLNVLVGTDSKKNSKNLKITTKENVKFANHQKLHAKQKSVHANGVNGFFCFK